jgi:hypothetical protein
MMHSGQRIPRVRMDLSVMHMSREATFCSAAKLQWLFTYAITKAVETAWRGG